MKNVKKENYFLFSFGRCSGFSFLEDLGFSSLGGSGVTGTIIPKSICFLTAALASTRACSFVHASPLLLSSAEAIST